MGGHSGKTGVQPVVDWLVDRFPEPAMSYFMQVVEDEVTDDTATDLREKIEQLRIREG